MALSTNTEAVPTRAPVLERDPFDTLRDQVQQCLQQFRQQPVTPVSARQLELHLKTYLDEAGRTLLQQEFNRCEPADKTQAAPKIRYRGDTYRLNKRTKASIATSFGLITLWSFLYLNSEDGEPGLHPLHVLLGISTDATTVLAERVALWAVTHSQREVRDLLLAEHGLKWSNDRLRHVLRDFRRQVVQFREEAQVRQLLQWLQTAAQSRGRHRPVLSVGRDGVMVPMRGLGYQEASTATIAVYDRRGKRLGTVYLGQMPQEHQATLSRELTAVVQRTLREWSGPLPRLVYVTDKGQAQDDYYRRVLRRMTNPRCPEQRLQWQWVLDFFHVCGYVGKLRDALFGNKARGQRWFARMRHWLRDRKLGVAQILRSAMQHYQRSSTVRFSPRRSEAPGLTYPSGLSEGGFTCPLFWNILPPKPYSTRRLSSLLP
jgi:hypothetical protein